MRALVTGCCGFIGSHLTESLLDDGHEVVGVDCVNDNYDRRRKLANLEPARERAALDFVPFDLARADDDLQALVDECAVVFHLAAEPGVRSSWGGRFEQYTRNNVLATQHVLEAARRSPGTRVVYASSSSVYGHAETLPTREDALPRPYSPYGVTKLAAEHLCGLYWGNFGVETVSLRYFSVYGPRQRPDMAFHRFARAALRGERLVVFGDGEQTRDFTYVADIVRATRAAGESSVAAGGVYNIGGGSRVSVNEALALLTDFAGRPLDVEYAETVKGDVRDTGADSARARADLGYDPQQTFADGLRAEFEWMASDLAARRGRFAREEVFAA